jgi:hypothetical protein
MIKRSKQTFLRTYISAPFSRAVCVMLMLTSFVLVPAVHQIAEPDREQSTSSLGTAAQYLEQGTFECAAQDQRTNFLEADCHTLGEHAHDTPLLAPHESSAMPEARRCWLTCKRPFADLSIGWPLDRPPRSIVTRG